MFFKSLIFYTVVESAFGEALVFIAFVVVVFLIFEPILDAALML